ncbi:MAG: type II toxin-antitoxin system death-on-curing family toxin [Methylobacter sp.]|uniref:type II toxin-antitoxin system death-on-curing family toxin n=1 Tax=Methylobacter sp. TaxID=2051955 RepID=UPI00258EF28E|nr:type II toxin-antitoxin system death-on-curing family toxin [Methylobacter sp.]MCL7420934.1 type II toxin-antitoxin system death-on-curing family toxin [Methylobacter sp.]
MIEPKWVLDEVVISVHQMLLAEHGGSLGIRDKALLESALARPKQRHDYEPDASFFDLTASYCFGIAKHHPFIDGNKRVAFTVAAIFLEINGFSFNASEPETVIIIEQLAAGELSEEELRQWFKRSSIENL